MNRGGEILRLVETPTTAAAAALLGAGVGSHGIRVEVESRGRWGGLGGTRRRGLGIRQWVGEVGRRGVRGGDRRGG